MAKDFSKYNDENPVMAILEKAKQDAAALIEERKNAAEQKSKQEIDKAKEAFEKNSLDAGSRTGKAKLFRADIAICNGRW